MTRQGARRFLAVAAALALTASGAFAQSLQTGGQATLQGGSNGADYSANTPTLPNVGSNFAASGPYASYVLLKTIPANLTRNCVYVMNTSGVQIAVVTDDGTAASGAAPVNGGVFALAGGSGTGAQGGTTDLQFCAFKGRVQLYAASSGAQVYAQVW